ncbi:MAG TPA: hypothetical protein VH414_15290 [Lichenihabitans sp.]|nr:hypothetical protein [Lichenihabitans sp.]
MYRSRSALVLGAIVSLLIPRLASGADLSVGKVATADRPGVLLAQYDGPGYYGPYGPGGGYDEGPFGGMPPGGPDGPYGNRPGYAAPRYRREPMRHGLRQRVTYHGFRIDLSQGAGSPNLASEVASVEHQIDIVDSVGLSMSDLQLFRSLPIRMTNGLRGGGHYSGGSYVTVGNLLTTDNRPVLLHEFMHVLQHRHMSGGFHNGDIRRFYVEALSNGLYQPGSYMLTNPGEYFAVTASCYLYGTVAREPFNRETIRERQPDYYAYLERLFGPARGSHLSTDGSDVLKPHMILPRHGPTAAWAG